MLDPQTLDLFKVIVLASDQKITAPQLDAVGHGYVTNFVPTGKQHAALRKAFQPLPITTLFCAAKDVPYSTKPERASKYVSRS